MAAMFAVAVRDELRDFVWFARFDEVIREAAQGRTPRRSAAEQVRVCAVRSRGRRRKND